VQAQYASSIEMNSRKANPFDFRNEAALDHLGITRYMDRGSITNRKIGYSQQQLILFKPFSDFAAIKRKRFRA
jgi:hypothetical protein